MQPSAAFLLDILLFMVLIYSSIFFPARVNKHEVLKLHQAFLLSEVPEFTRWELKALGIQRKHSAHDLCDPSICTAQHCKAQQRHLITKGQVSWQKAAQWTT